MKRIDNLPESSIEFTDAQIRNIINFLETVRGAIATLLSRGYTIKDGELIPPRELQYDEDSLAVRARAYRRRQFSSAPKTVKLVIKQPR